MKNSTRWLALFCAAALLFATVGCSESTENAETEAPSETVETEAISGETEAETEETIERLTDDLPEMNLGGHTYTILSRGEERTKNEICVEEMNGDVVNDAIFDREAAVEERLKCEITNIARGIDRHGNDLVTLVGNSVTAGDGAYDIFANSNYSTTNSMPNGYYLNLKDITTMDLTKDYWAQYLIQNSEINGALFGVTGSLSIYLYQEMFAVFFNRNLCHDYGIEADDVYNTVFEGGWTLDRMIEMTKDVYTDKNGDGVRDKNDIYGYGMQTSSSTDGYWSSCQIRMTSRDEAGNVYLDVDAEKLTNVTDKLKDFIWNQTGVIQLAEEQGYASESRYYMPEAFANNQLLFMNDWIYSTGTAIFRDMESDYGIIPYPKYDEAQQDYYSYLHDQFTIFTILSTVENPEDVGAVLEAMASDSYNRVVPAYYQTALTTKYARDTDSVKSLELIFKNAYLDTGWVYSLNMNSFPQKVLRDVVYTNMVMPTTALAGFGRTLNKIFEKMSADFAKAAEDVKYSAD